MKWADILDVRFRKVRFSENKVRIIGLIAQRYYMSFRPCYTMCAYRDFVSIIIGEAMLSNEKV